MTPIPNRSKLRPDGGEHMVRERDPETGTFVPAVTESDVWETFERVERPVITANDLTEHVGCTRATAHKHLQALAEQGTLGADMTGRAWVYWKEEGE